ncbi:hypothetical protein SODALDRAFT_364405 [Sodiomyces alkalinus F11]|uniref:Uncharacterized protein n=1 Tax=Sodiomyces alkalinus (strain CBS 110278 / VKM F-3762 / F11) TaxID=1314773 RepID=A0A3N2PIW1_SODAK|nr:hypothetical protein SODALDRAFT_364405 [Sodiomyces alkalinus F11]ROT34478.1 hypothetical protein SODALDRAFT_364405 [Sodiomyces alkalinus F11]
MSGVKAAQPQGLQDIKALDEASYQRLVLLSLGRSSSHCSPLHMDSRHIHNWLDARCYWQFLTAAVVDHWMISPIHILNEWQPFHEATRVLWGNPSKDMPPYLAELRNHSYFPSALQRGLKRAEPNFGKQSRPDRLLNFHVGQQRSNVTKHKATNDDGSPCRMWPFVSLEGPVASCAILEVLLQLRHVGLLESVPTVSDCRFDAGQEKRHTHYSEE